MAPDIHCIATFYDNSGVIVRVTAKEPGTATELEFVTMEFTQAQLTSRTSAGANDVVKGYNLVEQAVKAELETINPSASFSIV